MDEIPKEISDEKRQKESTENKPQISSKENKEKKIWLSKGIVNNNNDKDYKENKNRGEINNLLTINNANIKQNLKFQDFFKKKLYFNNINYNINDIKSNTVNQFYFGNNINNNLINENKVSNNINNNEQFIKKNEVNRINNSYPINFINVKQILNIFPNERTENPKNEIKDNFYHKPIIWDNFHNNNEMNKNFAKKDDLIYKSLNISNNSSKHLKNDDKMKIIVNIEIILALLSNFKGSIFLQDILTNINNEEISVLLTTIFQKISKIMCLEYGNYFIQKLIKKLNVQQRLSIYQIIENDFLNIAINKSGTHAIQCLIDNIESPLEQIYLEKLLNKNLLLLFNNENSYHIIMKIILEKPENQRNNINFFFVANVEKIVINPYGAYCGTKFLINNIDLNLRLILIKNIQKNIKILIFNKNSCSFLILSIKQFGINNFEFIIQEIQNNLSFLSLHPIANSFICKIFYFLKNSENSKINSIIWNIFRNDKLINMLCSNKNGNKLIKQLMEYSNNTQKKYIKAKLSFIKAFN